MWRVSLVVLGALLVSACSRLPTFTYLETHPDFPPIVPREGATEYQIVWSRSWRPIIYLRAYSLEYLYEEDDVRKYYVEWAISDHFVDALNRVEISEKDWAKIVASFDKSKFWRYKSSCDELNYQTRDQHACENAKLGENEVIVTADGATISIAASEENRSKGILVACPNLQLCEPFGELAIAILSVIGRESEAHYPDAT